MMTVRHRLPGFPSLAGACLWPITRIDSTKNLSQWMIIARDIIWFNFNIKIVSQGRPLAFLRFSPIFYTCFPGAWMFTCLWLSHRLGQPHRLPLLHRLGLPRRLGQPHRLGLPHRLMIGWLTVHRGVLVSWLTGGGIGVTVRDRLGNPELWHGKSWYPQVRKQSPGDYTS